MTKTPENPITFSNKSSKKELWAIQRWQERKQTVEIITREIKRTISIVTNISQGNNLDKFHVNKDKFSSNMDKFNSGNKVPGTFAALRKVTAVKFAKWSILPHIITHIIIIITTLIMPKGKYQSL